MLSTLGSLIRKETGEQDSLLVSPHHLVGYSAGQTTKMELLEYMPMYRISSPGTVLIAPCHHSLKNRGLTDRKYQVIKLSVIFNLVLFAVLLSFPLMFGGTYEDFINILLEFLL